MKKRFFLIFSATLLSACASPPVVQSPAELAATHGYVFAHIPGTGSRGRPSARSLQNNSEYVLPPRGEPDAYGAWLPAGEYTLPRWTLPSGRAYPSFTVKAGRLTDLGTFFNFQIGDGESVTVTVKHVEIDGRVKKAIEEYRPYLVSEETIDWMPQVPPSPVKRPAAETGLGLVADLITEYGRQITQPPLNRQLRDAKSIQDFFRLAKSTMPPLYDEPAVDGDSNLYYGARFGQ